MSSHTASVSNEENVVNTMETINDMTDKNITRTYDDVLKDYYDTQKNRNSCSICIIS